MKFSAVLLAFIPAILAQPVQQRDGKGSVSLRLSNSQTNAVGESTIPIDGVPHNIGQEFSKTPIYQAGAVQADEAKLIQPPQVDFNCSLATPGQTPYVHLSKSLLRAGLDGGNKPRSLQGDIITCN